MKDKDTKLIWETHNKTIQDRGTPVSKNDIYWRDDMWKEYYLGHDLDAIQELVDFLKSEEDYGGARFVEGTHYKLHTGYGDDLPNTVSIHKDFAAREWEERKLKELLDGATGPAEGEDDEEDEWFEENDHDQDDGNSRARRIYAIGQADKAEGNKQKAALTEFGSYSDYYTRGFYGMPFEAESRSKEEEQKSFDKAWGPSIAAHYAKGSPHARKTLR